LRRREFITLLGGAAAASYASWPLAVRAQQGAMPVIGFLHPSSPDPYRVRAFQPGLKDVGVVEGENGAVEYRWADNRIDRLPALAAELVQRRFAVIATGGAPAVFAAKAATTAIPVVFVLGEDPVRLGLVGSLARPGGNLTGINFFAAELAAKRLELLREVVPAAVRIAVFINPTNPTTEAGLRDVEQAARGIGLQIQVFNVSSVHDIDTAFATLAIEKADALFVANDPIFIDRRVQLAQWAAHRSLPTIHQDRLFAEAGGLMSYGASVGDAWRQVGVYTGRILKGAKAADLPVVQSTKFELVINASTARMLGLTVPEKLLATADEVIE
jgi:putative tryptophan/tyrosine transport system substrate-binding protein